MENSLNPEYHLYPAAVQPVRSPARHTDGRPGWPILILVLAVLLCGLGGGILIRDVQRNSGILLAASQDLQVLRASIAHPAAVVQQAERTQPAPVAAAKEALAPPPVTPAVEPENGNAPVRLLSGLPATAPSEPAVEQGRSNGDAVSALSVFQRMHNGQGRRQNPTGAMVPYLKNLLASAEGAGGTVAGTSADDTRSVLERLANGVRYRANKSGYGKPPTLSDKVVVNYLETTSDGALVEETYSSGKPVTLDMRSLGAGLQTALLKMPEGAEWEVYVPAAAAPADTKKTDGTSPGAQHVYLIELLKVVRERESGR